MDVTIYPFIPHGHLYCVQFGAVMSKPLPGLCVVNGFLAYTLGKKISGCRVSAHLTL
jgi:hypothetical protein